MSFDSNWPQFGDVLTSARLRDQWNGLDQRITTIPKGDKGDPGNDGAVGPVGPPMANVTVDAVNTLNPDDPATVDASFDGTNVHLTLGIPRGHDGAPGANGNDGGQGGQGEKGDKGDKGDPGDVTAQQLSDGLTAAIATAAANSSANSNGVGLIDTSGISDPVMLMLADKINELITAQRR